MNEENSAEKLISINNANNDILKSDALEFAGKWGRENLSVPATYVNWEIILNQVSEENPQVLGPWSHKLEVTNDLQRALGKLGHIADTFVDYVNYVRKTNIKRVINTYSGLGFLELSIDKDGNDFYELSSRKNEIKPEVAELIGEIIKSYDKFK